MEILIKNPVKVPKYKNTYELVINFMEGDADDYHKSVVMIKEEHIDHLKDLLDVVIRCNNAYQHGRGGCDEYNHIEGYNKYFSVEDLSEEEYDKLTEIFKSKHHNDSLIDHPYDSNSDCHDSFDGYELYYYDENYNKFETEVVI
jgi:hypothetical protein